MQHLTYKRNHLLTPQKACPGQACLLVIMVWSATVVVRSIQVVVDCLVVSPPLSMRDYSAKVRLLGVVDCLVVSTPLSMVDYSAKECTLGVVDCLVVGRSLCLVGPLTASRFEEVQCFQRGLQYYNCLISPQMPEKDKLIYFE